jgi:hypothetical protein
MIFTWVCTIFKRNILPHSSGLKIEHNPIL